MAFPFFVDGGKVGRSGLMRVAGSLTSKYYVTQRENLSPPHISTVYQDRSHGSPNTTHDGCT